MEPHEKAAVEFPLRPRAKVKNPGEKDLSQICRQPGNSVVRSARLNGKQILFATQRNLFS